MKENNFETIERYIKGLADKNEISWVESQFLKGEENHSLQHLLKNDWDKLNVDSSSAKVDLNHILDQIHHKIRKNESLHHNNPIQKFIRIYYNVAAILLLPVLIAGVLVYSYLGKDGKAVINGQTISTLYAPLGARVSFNLPDGTIGMLNSGSNISYSLPFTNNRQVKLEGEAWLKVSHNEDHPFIISAGNSTVKVLGTTFNISAYKAENYIEVVLEQGSVEFKDNIDNIKMTLLPSERLVFKNGNISKSVIDPSKYNAWTAGKLVFRGDLMVEVAHRIERWYNVKVELADKELEKYSFRGTFQDDSLEEVLRFISMTSPIRYKITPRTLMQDSTYKKEEVTIFLNKRLLNIKTKSYDNNRWPLKK